MFDFFRQQTGLPRFERMSQLSLFVNLTPAELRIVESLVHERDYLADEVIFDEGEEGHALYIIAQGEVAICRPGLNRAGELARLGPGSFFGELALLDDTPRSAQARAAMDARLLVLFRDDFIGLLDTHVRIASKITRDLARHLANRVRTMDDRLEFRA